LPYGELPFPKETEKKYVFQPAEDVKYTHSLDAIFSVKRWRRSAKLW